MPYAFSIYLGVVSSVILIMHALRNKDVSKVYLVPATMRRRSSGRKRSE